MSKTDEKHSDRDGQFLQKTVTPTANLSLVVSNLMQHTAFTILSGKIQRSQKEVFGNNADFKQCYDLIMA